MAEMLLINPRRRTARKTKSVKRRRSNPIAAVKRTVAKRRRNPIAAVRRAVSRRRRNPISLGVSQAHFMSEIKNAMVGASGAVVVDVLMGQINPHLPASMQTNATTVGVGDAVKAVITVLLGKMLSKSTRGMSQKMATGALTVQAHGIISAYLPSSVTVAGMAYASPAKIVQGSNRVGPIRPGVNAYNRPGSSPMLNAYTPGSQMLSAHRNQAATREGVAVR
jgi:Holliday junction resolvasome RuvABC endonuclease subunit